MVRHFGRNWRKFLDFDLQRSRILHFEDLGSGKNQKIINKKCIDVGRFHFLTDVDFFN